MKPERLIHAALLAASIFWCLLILSGPLAAVFHAHTPSVVEYIQRFFSKVCHQDPARSLHVLGESLAVCIRCSAVYFGFLFGLTSILVLPSPHPKNFPLWLSILVLPMIIDVMLDASGIHSSTMVTRTLTGGFFGSGIAVLLLPLLIGGFLSFLRQALANSPVSQHYRTSSNDRET